MQLEQIDQHKIKNTKNGNASIYYCVHLLRAEYHADSTDNDDDDDDSDCM